MHALYKCIHTLLRHLNIRQDYAAAVGLSGVACIRPSTTAAKGFAADEFGYASKNDLHERI
eukprot:10609-Heterococcus_DN1.PRE.4